MKKSEQDIQRLMSAARLAEPAQGSDQAPFGFATRISALAVEAQRGKRMVWDALVWKFAFFAVCTAVCLSFVAKDAIEVLPDSIDDIAMNQSLETEEYL